MTSKRIKPWQAQRIDKSLDKLMDNLNRLRGRMEFVNAHDNPRLFELVKEAHRAMHELKIELYCIRFGVELDGTPREAPADVPALDSKPPDQARRGL